MNKNIKTFYIGIDLGLTGAIAVLDENGFLIAVYDMPVVKNNGYVKNKVDEVALSQILHTYDNATVIIEKVTAMPGQGVSSMFSLGDSFGVVRGVVAAVGSALVYTKPAEWKPACGLSKDKNESIKAAIVTVKGSDIYLTRKKDHNRAEALLLARYLQKVARFAA